jgi:hypothetical protein
MFGLPAPDPRGSVADSAGTDRTDERAQLIAFDEAIGTLRPDGRGARRRTCHSDRAWGSWMERGSGFKGQDVVIVAREVRTAHLERLALALHRELLGLKDEP